MILTLLLSRLLSYQVFGEFLDERFEMHRPCPRVTHEAQVEVVRVARILLVVYTHWEPQDFGPQESPAK